jgi:ribonuclease P protein component
VFRLRECVVFRIPNDREHFRLGITLKARGRSVDRNRVKRRIREAFRALADRLGAHDYNVVVPASKKMIFPYPEKLAECLETEFKNALARKSDH